MPRQCEILVIKLGRDGPRVSPQDAAASAMLRPALLICASCLSVAAATLHVNVKGDGQGDGSAAKPFRTIQEAAEKAEPGDTVLVAPGIYRERIAPPRGGKEGAPIVFRSSEKYGAVVRGSTPWKPTWQKVAPGIYSGPVDESLFADASHVDGAIPSASRHPPRPTAARANPRRSVSTRTATRSFRSTWDRSSSTMSATNRNPTRPHTPNVPRLGVTITAH